MIKHKNYNCQITTEDGEQHLVFAEWIHEQGLDTWKGYQCDAGNTRFMIDKNFDIWSGECKHDHLGNVMGKWNLKTDTVCRRERCTGCADDLLTKKYSE
jgi:hypothetical protein